MIIKTSPSLAVSPRSYLPCNAMKHKPKWVSSAYPLIACVRWTVYPGRRNTTDMTRWEDRRTTLIRCHWHWDRASRWANSRPDLRFHNERNLTMSSRAEINCFLKIKLITNDIEVKTSVMVLWNILEISLSILSLNLSVFPTLFLDCLLGSRPMHKWLHLQWTLLSSMHIHFALFLQNNLIA